MELTRRGLLIGAAVGGGLFVAWGLGGRHFAPPLTPREGEFAFDAWLKIGKDGVVSVAVPDLEMGQGITTLIPQIGLSAFLGGFQVFHDGSSWWLEMGMTQGVGRVCAG